MGDAGVGCIPRAGHRAAAQPRGGVRFQSPEPCVAIARTSLVVVVVRFLRIPAPKLRVEHMAYGLLASGIYLTFKIRSLSKKNTHL